MKKIGIIADDFTGASDIGSFMNLSGAQTLLINGINNIPKIDYELFDVIIVALKSRSNNKEDAVFDTNSALKFLLKEGYDTIYFKYGSTFDSTEEGNIGPVADFLMEERNEKFTVIAPSFPINGRTVKDSILYIEGKKLEDTHMRTHPVNPMTESSLIRLVERQSKYPAFNISIHQLELFSQNREKYTKFIDQFNGHEHFYLIPDYFEEYHGKLIAKVFKQLTLYTGASVFGGWVYQVHADNLKKYYPDSKDKICLKNDESIENSSIVFAGSLSNTTKLQILEYKKHSFPYYEINSKALSTNFQKERLQIQHFIKNNIGTPILIHSEQKTAETSVSVLIEEILSDSAVFAMENGIRNVVVAGGETSGAVVQKLGVNAFEISDSISPGVPILIPHDKLNKCKIVLKSGNFGDDKFFLRALTLMGDLNE